MREYLLDANVIVRVLVHDDAKQYAASVVLLEKAERREIVLHLDPLTISEAIFVLTRRYGRTRVDVANTLLAFIQTAGIAVDNHATVQDALQRFALFNVDYTDAWLAAKSARLGHAVASFDRDFDKFKDVKRFEPVR